MPEMTLDEAKSKIIELTESLEECQKKADDNLAGWKRSKADYINFQKDVEKNRQSWIEFANAELIKDLLPISTCFASLVEQLPTDADNSWKIGIQHLEKMLQDVFKKYNVERIETVGSLFDPEWHEAVGQEKTEQPSNTIVKEIAPGFKINNKILTPPKVIVAE